MKFHNEQQRLPLLGGVVQAQRLIVPPEIIMGIKSWRHACRLAWRLRRPKGMTQRTLAELAGLHPPHVSAYFSVHADRRELPARYIASVEGVVGAPILLGQRNSPYQAVVMQPGLAVRVRTEAVKKEFRRRGLRELLLPYAHALLTESAQSAACHRFHTPLERLCRWLLTVQDRAGADEFRATQEFISGMLGTRRAGVTLAAGRLHARGLVRYRRGEMEILDRRGLEDAACECYAYGNLLHRQVFRE